MSVQVEADDPNTPLLRSNPHPALPNPKHQSLLARLRSPDSTARHVWNILLTICVLYNTILTPLRMGFQIIWTSPAAMIIFYVLDYASDVFLILDVALNFLTSFNAMGAKITNISLTSKYYLARWFVLDLVATLPYDIFYWKSLLVHFMLRMPRLLRIPHVFYLFAEMELRSDKPHYYPLARLLSGIVLMNHVLASIYFVIAYIQGFGTTPMMPPVGTDTQPLHIQYLIAFFWSTNVVTRVGGSVARPTTIGETIYMLIIAFVALFVVALIIGGVADVISSLNEGRHKFRRKLDSVKAFLVHKRVPADLQARVTDYYAHIWSRKQGEDDEAILGDLPPHLRTDISLFINRDIVEKVPLFQSGPPGFIKMIVSHLRPRIFAPGDWIIRTGDVGNEMYFISSGIVDIQDSHGHHRTTLGAGDYFGEIVLLLDTTRTASARAKTYCDIFALSKADFQDILKHFSEQGPILQEMAECRIGQDMIRALLPKEKFYADCSAEFLEDMEVLFASEKYGPNSVVATADDRQMHPRLMFVVSGGLNVVDWNGKEVASLSEGSFFGHSDVLGPLLLPEHEAKMLSRPLARCSVISSPGADGRTLLFCLSLDSLRTVLLQSPADRSKLTIMLRRQMEAQQSSEPSDSIRSAGLLNKKMRQSNISKNRKLVEQEGLLQRRVSSFLLQMGSPPSKPPQAPISEEKQVYSDRIKKLQRFSHSPTPEDSRVGSQSTSSSATGSIIAGKLDSLAVEDLSPQDALVALLAVARLQQRLLTSLNSMSV